MFESNTVFHRLGYLWLVEQWVPIITFIVTTMHSITITAVNLSFSFAAITNGMNRREPSGTVDAL